MYDESERKYLYIIDYTEVVWPPSLVISLPSTNHIWPQWPSKIWQGFTSLGHPGQSIQVNTLHQLSLCYTFCKNLMFFSTVSTFLLVIQVLLWMPLSVYNYLFYHREDMKGAGLFICNIVHWFLVAEHIRKYNSLLFCPEEGAGGDLSNKTESNVQFISVFEA